VTHRTPTYRLHRPTGQAVVTIAGRDIYLGRHGSPESHADYDRVIAERLVSGRGTLPSGPATSGPTVSELLVQYLRHAEAYYKRVVCAEKADGGRPPLRHASSRMNLYGRSGRSST
jgi:hypothetical protein